MQKVIAVCGKGGVGKTALTAMLTRQLKKRADTGRLLVVDADPALGLLYALNVETDKTIGAVRDKVLAAATPAHRPKSPMNSTTSSRARFLKKTAIRPLPWVA